MQNEKHENTTVSDSQTDVPTPPRAEDRANEKIKENHGNENHKPEGLRPPEIKEDAFAWLQVLGAFCLNLNTWGLMNAFGVFQTYYQLDGLPSYSASSIAWIGSTQAFLLFLVSLIAGPLFDRGYLRALLCVGSLLLVLGMFLTSIASQYWHFFLAQAVMTGLGFGCVYLPAPAVVSQYFRKSLALANGAASTGSAVGGVIFPIVFTQIQLHIGFQWAVRVLGFVLLATSVIATGVMKSQTPPRPSRSLVDRSAFRDVPYLLLNLGLFFGFMGLYVVFNYIQLLALSRTNASSNLADYLLVIINASSLPGRLIPSYYADKIGSVNVQTAVALASAVLVFALIAVRTAASVIAVSVLFGFMAGAFMGLPAAGVVSLSADKSKIGTRLGMTLAFVGVGVLVSNPIAGAILGSDDGNWVGLLGWAGALLAASSVAMAASRVAKVGFGLTKVV